MTTHPSICHMDLEQNFKWEKQNSFQAGTPLLVPHCLSDFSSHLSMQEYLMRSCPSSVVPCFAAFEHWQRATCECLQQILWRELSRSDPLSRHNCLVHQVTLFVPWSLPHSGGSLIVSGEQHAPGTSPHTCVFYCSSPASTTRLPIVLSSFLVHTTSFCWYSLAANSLKFSLQGPIS